MISLRRVARALGASLLVSGLIATAAAAATITCGERGSSYRRLSEADGALTISVTRNSHVSWQAYSGTPRVEADIGGGYVTVIAPGDFRIASDSLTAFRIRLADAAGEILVSCVNNQPPLLGNAASSVAADNQLGATTTGIGANSLSRFGMGGDVISQNRIFMSSSNHGRASFTAPDWSGWATVEGRVYSGGISGTALDFVGGVDRLVTPDLLLGVLGGYGRAFVTQSGTPQTSNSPMIGTYLGLRLNAISVLDAFVSFARPQYQVSGTTFLSSRLSAGINLSGRFERPKTTIEPFLHATTYREAQPSYMISGGSVIAANATQHLNASLGVKVEFAGSDSAEGALVPYVSAAADYRWSNTTATGTDISLAPRFAFGVEGTLGKGRFSAKIDMGKTRSDTIDRGVRLGYEMKW